MPEITCIEPYPSAALRQRTKDIRLIPELCQTVPAAVFAGLSTGDFLFVDSSHAVKLGSDVIRIYLDIIPHLAPGVLIHIHDVYLPYLYPRDALFKPFGWQETALLLALLINNPRLQVLSCLSALHYERPAQLKQFLSTMRPRMAFAGWPSLPIPREISPLVCGCRRAEAVPARSLLLRFSCPAPEQSACER